MAIQKVSISFHGYQGTEIVRSQFPLILCYASTCHKIQGSTLEKAVIDLGKDIFQSQMAYVALSPVKKLENLALTAFMENKIRTDKKVVNEYKSLNAPWKHCYKTNSA